MHIRRGPCGMPTSTMQRILAHEPTRKTLMDIGSDAPLVPDWDLEFRVHASIHFRFRDASADLHDICCNLRCSERRINGAGWVGWRMPLQLRASCGHMPVVVGSYPRTTRGWAHQPWMHFGTYCVVYPTADSWLQFILRLRANYPGRVR